MSEPVELIPLNQAVAEAMKEEWDTMTGTDELADWIRLADVAIATIEYDYMLVERGPVLRP